MAVRAKGKRRRRGGGGGGGGGGEGGHYSTRKVNFLRVIVSSENYQCN
jgi:hypothetical protein